MRLLFAGTPAAAVPSLRLLLDSPRHDVVAVLTRPDARSGRGRTVTRSPVGTVADEAGIPVFTPRRPSDPDFLQTLTGLAVDCAPVVAYGALLPASVLLVPRLGWINLHFSLLPAWRGAAPVQHAILNCDEITGASTFLIEAGLDSGPVFGVTTEQIGAHDTSGDLLGRLSVSGAGLLAATLDALADGEVAPREQPTDGISLAPKLSVEDARIDFTRPAVAVDRRIRACTPAPGAWTTWRGERLKLGPARIAAVPAGELAPGGIRVDGSSVLVGTSTRAITLGSVQPAGRNPMSAPDWARGARPGDDEHLG
jgi:methionyl-tRNA formyltransferase